MKYRSGVASHSALTARTQDEALAVPSREDEDTAIGVEDRHNTRSLFGRQDTRRVGSAPVDRAAPTVVQLATMSSAAEQFVSRGEYLSLERDGSVRHEWVGGQMWAMTGGTGRHNRISIRLLSQLLPSAEAAGCRTYLADMKVLTESAGYYPDLMVVCDQNEPSDYHEENPCLLAEVLSKSTSDRDHREKWMIYRSIASLQHYLLLSQTDATIEHRYRTEIGWATEVLGPTDTLHLRCPKVSVSVEALYVGLLERSE